MFDYPNTYEIDEIIKFIRTLMRHNGAITSQIHGFIGLLFTKTFYLYTKNITASMQV